MVRIRVEYKLWLRELTGTSVEEYVLEDPRLSRLIERVRARHPRLKRYLENILDKENPVIILIDGKPVNKDIVLKDNTVVKLLPPVSGG